MESGRSIDRSTFREIELGSPIVHGGERSDGRAHVLLSSSLALFCDATRCDAMRCHAALERERGREKEREAERERERGREGERERERERE